MFVRVMELWVGVKGSPLKIDHTFNKHSFLVLVTVLNFLIKDIRTHARVNY